MVKEFIEGTAIKITTILSDVITSATISITSPSNVQVVDAQAMTKVADRTYTYVYQTSIGDLTGVYEISITATATEGNSVKLAHFCLADQRLD